MQIDKKDVISYKELKPGSLIECYFKTRETLLYNESDITYYYVQETRDFFFNDTFKGFWVTEHVPTYVFLKVVVWELTEHLLVYSLTHKTIGHIPVNNTIIKLVS